jgi:TonB family protein
VVGRCGIRFDCDRFSLPILLGAAVCLLAIAPVRAASYKVSLDELAHQLTADIAKSDVRSVAVADFLGDNGQKSDLGMYLAEKLSDGFEALPDHAFRFLDRAAMQASKVTAQDLASPDSFRHVGFLWGVAAIVTGVVEVSDQQYLIKACVRRVADGTIVATESQSLPHTRLLDLLSPAGISPEAAHPAFAGAWGTGVPICAYCPIPSSSKSRYVQQASVTLQVTISSTGATIKISVLQDPGYEFLGLAIESVSNWTFKPALKKDGTPTTVVVPIEVTFRIYRT